MQDPTEKHFGEVGILNKLLLLFFFIIIFSFTVNCLVYLTFIVKCLQQMADMVGKYMEDEKIKFIKKHVPTKVNSGN